MTTKTKPGVPVNVKFSAVDAAGRPTSEAECAQAIRAAGWWLTAKLDECWPLTTKDAAALLHRAGGFDVDADALVELTRRKLLRAPATGASGKLAWSATDIIAATDTLDRRQQWRPGSGHDAKKSGPQLMVEQAARSGRLADVNYDAKTGTRYDLRHILVGLVNEETLAGRQLLVAVATAILEAEHGIKV